MHDGRSSSRQEVSAQWDLIVPVKHLHLAKSRMRSLPRDARSRLMLAMATDALVAMTAAARVRGLCVVTGDPEVASLASRLRSTVLVDPDRGLNAAVARGIRHVRRERPHGSVAAVTADLPALTPAVLDHALALAARVPKAFVVDASGTGTTMLSAAQGVVLEPQFGPGSAVRHEAWGATPLIAPGLERLRRDVDTEADLESACQLGVGPATRQYANWDLNRAWHRSPGSGRSGRVEGRRSSVAVR
jgi:2-phospho-L-lactate/phosphoenolpyruvate guanylyltransferase